ncbi:uncharacterized protein MELLADRAFT_103430 [Melampsora larici-populina 98AG31]|uniref:Uncharacterized protein n=1 Tax=Melampsora larici-populina (strain 98AG31 / pathotype 3-4-7) TaxID=747676 RepID=F4RBF7_MELLP|nr:uncharacterized protein MELLADRAFT_103430 [Melampsora larici-populina 98AG31]EGG10077.1 hypothetical protein MELLADRAFT_103430 [Melampsora larici-populina 98AG31]
MQQLDQFETTIKAATNTQRQWRACVTTKQCEVESAQETANDIKNKPIKIEPQFYCDYFYFYSNFNCYILACAAVTFGSRVIVGSTVQIYAPNDILTHPFCSPALVPSLGGLPPLFIIAGDNEVLRDEIIYAKAALYPPMKVHLQVYVDDMCHVLPMFSCALPAKYCYRAINFVTSASKPKVSLSSACSPQSSIDGITPLANPLTAHPASISGAGPSSGSAHPTPSPTVVVSLQSDTPEAQSSELRFEKPTGSLTLMIPGAKASSSANACASLSTSPEGQAPSTWGRITGGKRNPNDNMVRERVDVNGKIQKLEDETNLNGLWLDKELIGVIQEGPVRRWAKRKEIWNHKSSARRFMKLHKKIQFQRDHHVKR